MSGMVGSSEPSGGFDMPRMDAATLHDKRPVSAKPAGAGRNVVPSTWTWYHRLYRCGMLSWRWRLAFFQMARRTGLDQSWFAPFQQYWVEVLGGRPLWSVHDFYFLRGLYRLRFQAQRLPRTEDASELLAAWQCPEMLWQLLFFVSREAESQRTDLVRLLQRHLKWQPQRVLEYGCGSAPFTTSWFDFVRPRGVTEFLLADIGTLAFHYAAHKFARCSNVQPVLLRPETGFQWERNDPLDAIVATTVFEHMNRPLTTVQRFQELLRPGGLLLFDYYRGEQGAWDTAAGQTQRDDVLRFIGKHFDIVSGGIEMERTTGLTVARRREG